MGNILFIGPHPDDIEISCLGTLLKRQANNDHIIMVYVSECSDLPRNKTLMAESLEALSIISPDRMHRLDLPNRELDRSENTTLLRGALEHIRDNTKIDLVYCPWLHDIHQDHRAVSEVAIGVFRYNSIMMYENIHSTPHFDPNIYERISADHFSKKIELLSLYKSQDQHQIQRMVRLLMPMRGQEVSSDFAEAFYCWRGIR